MAPPPASAALRAAARSLAGELLTESGGGGAGFPSIAAFVQNAAARSDSSWSELHSLSSWVTLRQPFTRLKTRRVGANGSAGPASASTSACAAVTSGNATVRRQGGYFTDLLLTCDALARLESGPAPSCTLPRCFALGDGHGDGDGGKTGRQGVNGSTIGRDRASTTRRGKATSTMRVSRRQRVSGRGSERQQAGAARGRRAAAAVLLSLVNTAGSIVTLFVSYT